ncbi:hypothetical protein EIN_032620 [Entamoeba invadens IP1]|uniref:CinA C-terminal domain-containing protein n=2 Tax=Entamoeba invadens TaxID=33085 RepID=A0A0A1U457_ENTIV|nr:hypothetical protein EIN_032620 [Entamoeba invadens IP1]ELP86471.1 hypothetical protein EIN_032620 [Entamoeba invadens IP1]BAN40874.1 hypothetical protein, conserved [Entamoeba invadens]|eukprot:XP_004185817.1 hypothetical protein EIN_032620 [Entamoeba invadens IP1]
MILFNVLTLSFVCVNAFLMKDNVKLSGTKNSIENTEFMSMPNYTSIALEIQTLLLKQKKTVSTAESCTSGKIAAALSCISNASKVFKGGIVAYCNEAKENLLKVPHHIIANYTEVSEQTIKEMLKGSMSAYRSDYAIASTGYAELDITAPKERQGLIYIGVSSKDKFSIKELHVTGARVDNTNEAVTEALTLFVEFLKADN